MKKWLRRVLREMALRLLGKVDLYAFLKAHSPSEQYRAQAPERLLHQLAHCGTHVHLNGHVQIEGPQFVSIGNNVHIGDGAYIKAAGGLVIGDHVHISRNLTVYTVNHQYEGERLPYDESLRYKPVIIERNVWIGMNVCITPGVTIGEGAIIGMGTVVTRDVPAFSIVGNQPYRILKQRDPDHYAATDARAAYGGVNGREIPPAVRQDFHVSGRAKGSQLFFVVSTGRAGSTSIARILSQHPQITCRHEPNRQLIRLSTEYAHGIKDADQVRKELRAMYVDNGLFPSTGFYGESDQKLGNLILLMSELLPEAKFIWLTRNAFDFVASGASRGWFETDEAKRYKELDRNEEMRHWVQFRLNGALTGELTEHEWSKLSHFERNAWYWSYWNKLIESQLLQLDSNRWLHIQLEKLGEQLPAINRFIGAQNFTFEMVKSNQATYELTPPSNWSPAQKKQIAHWCTAGMSAWYPSSLFKADFSI